jgi:predicted transcriptional regulator
MRTTTVRRTIEQSIPELKRIKTLALLLSSCTSGSTLTKLSGNISVTRDSLASYVGMLRPEGYLTTRVKNNEDMFVTTEHGQRFLRSFVSIYRAAGNWLDTGAKKTTHNSELYVPCSNCAPHPAYPKLTPQTLHVNGYCQVCNARTAA